ncbi:putative translation initiation factor eIF-2B subunit gamma [Diplonema papillatum]|nr:putative translation initiation factor eIF-2B subunit gamma [Diplonema papillatum]
MAQDAGKAEAPAPKSSAASDFSSMYKEFTAVILAGGEGTRLAPLTHGKGKAVMPVCNHAMMGYAVRWLAAGGFTKPFIVTSESQHQEVEAWCAKECPALGVHPSIHVVSDDAETAEALKAVANKVERDVLVVSCDTITDIPISKILSQHRGTRATATVVCRHKKDYDSKSKERHLIEFFGLEKQNRITFFASSAELSDQMTYIKKSFLARRPCMTLTTSLLDGHIYVLNKWALDLLEKKQEITSLKHELLPLLSSQQFRRIKQDGTWGDLGVPPPPHPMLADAEDDLLGPVLKGIISIDDLSSKKDVAALSPFAPPPSSSYDPISVYAFIADNNGALAVDPAEAKLISEQKKAGEYLTRACHISTFVEACRDVAKGITAVAGGRATGGAVWVSSIAAALAAEYEENWTKPSREGIFPNRASVSSPSAVGVNYQPGESAIVKATVIGNNVTIGTNTRVSQCILLDGVTIAANCTLQGCIIGYDTRIPEKTILKECVVGNSVDSLKGHTEHKNEVISNEEL